MADRMEIIARDREWQQFKLSRSKSECYNGKYKHTYRNDSHLARSKSAHIENIF